MINNDFSNPLSRYFANRASSKNESSAADLYKKLRDRKNKVEGKETENTDSTNKTASDKTASSKSSSQSSGLKELLDRINSELDQGKSLGSDKKTNSSDKTNSTNSSSDNKTNENSNVMSFTNEDMQKYMETGELNFPEFLNDLPLFSQFKEDLASAFKSLDGATAGGISAQYELNFRSVQMIANEAGGYDVEEVSYNFKLDLNYVKAASGSDKNSSLSDLFGSGKTNPSPTDFLSSMKDYFSPEKTSERIVDFSTAFFPISKQFKEMGDTEESRFAFAEIMKKAVQKGFDQAMGTLGKVTGPVKDGIDKTHELTFKGIDDFIKNGMDWKNGGNKTNSDKNDIYSSLQEFSLSMNQSYTKKSYSISADQVKNYTYGQQNNTTLKAADPADPAIDAQA